MNVLDPTKFFADAKLTFMASLLAAVPIFFTGCIYQGGSTVKLALLALIAYMMFAMYKLLFSKSSETTSEVRVLTLSSITALSLALGMLYGSGTFSAI